MDVSGAQPEEIAVAVDPSDDKDRKRPVQISGPAYKRISSASNATGIPRSQILEWMLMRQTAKDLSTMIKEAGVKRKPMGRAKQRYHA